MTPQIVTSIEEKIKFAGYSFYLLLKNCPVKRERRDDILGITDEELETWIQQQVTIPIDNTFPKYVMENVEHLKSIGSIAKCIF
ncbi:hypothetical protein RHABOEDO_001440 [Candidatus Rhabdochlamydia oedothoracis]|uniref:Uncharacterized protein n=1 Tax=Candidatus Rhabdochlamydia oedothoracis TaxID=2720720 RepID=A0ABX8V1U0_9BACT|nr:MULTISPECIES: hypothetical protein [Rhabdochlamydia]KAG6558700.1 hypothetical protein RHOW815_001308 [Candidatus Rhabdochlamydia sp. W815]MCL6756487.1 hypothetical protein [Candidatus Rhabdochlamydia oedothoracis]QYF49159.1 hypothetical protein RHABOEDO_001440 [Candidatus Rhabdochlamydia oedothoracis]